VIEWQSEDEALQFTTSYISDLEEAQDSDLLFSSTEEILISGSAFSLLIGFDYSELSLEYVQANDKLTDSGSLKMTNLEYAWFVGYNKQLSIRLEHNEVLSALPKWRCGVAGQWRLAEIYTLSSELLYARTNNAVNAGQKNSSEIQIGFGISMEY